MFFILIYILHAFLQLCSQFTVVFLVAIFLYRRFSIFPVKSYCLFLFILYEKLKTSMLAILKEAHDPNMSLHPYLFLRGLPIPLKLSL